MSISKIRAALEARINTMSPALSTAYENVAFTPATGTPYQRVNMLPARPDNAAIGGSYYREVGVWQVTLCYPQNTGPGAAQARAEAIQDHFIRGTVLTASGVSVLMTRTPAIGPALIDGDRYCVPVSVSYQAEVFS